MQPKPHKCRQVRLWIQNLILADTERKIEHKYAKWGKSKYALAVVAAKQPNIGADPRRITTDYTEVN